MQSMSEPSAMTGLPDPQRRHPRRRECRRRRVSMVKPFFSRMPVRYLLRLELLEAELAEAEDHVDHLLAEVEHRLRLHVGGHGGLERRRAWGRRMPAFAAGAAVVAGDCASSGAPDSDATAMAAKAESNSLFMR